MILWASGVFKAPMLTQLLVILIAQTWISQVRTGLSVDSSCMVIPK